MAQRVIRGSKDGALAFALRRVLNAKLTALGEVIEVSLDTADRRARLRVMLHGEAEPIEVEFVRYQLERTGDDDWLTVIDAVSSREWLTAALRQFVLGRRFHLSRPTASALGLLA